MIPPLPPNSTTLVLRRAFTDTRIRVFRSWIEPAALEHWFRPKGKGVTVRFLDARVGGSFRFDLDDGSSTIGTYLQIVSPEKLVFIWSVGAAQGRETVVTLDFLDQGPVTEVVLTHERLITPELHAMFAGGWPSLLDLLAEVLSSPPLDF